MSDVVDLSTVTWEPPGPGPWQQDSAHTPTAQTRIIADVYPPGFDKGFTECFGRYGLLLDRLALGVVNGFNYHQPQPFDLPGPDGPLTDEQIGAEVGRRAALAAEALTTKLWLRDLADWDGEWKPRALRRHRELGDVDRAALDDEALMGHFHEVVIHATEMAYQHHRFNVAALLPVGDFVLQAAEMLHVDPTTLFPVLDGYSPISGVASDELAPAVEQVRADAEATALVRGDGDAADRLARLRERCGAVDDYVRIAGLRLLDGFDVVAPTLGERPDLVLGRIAAALDADPGEARRRSDAFAASLRERLDPDQQARFDEGLADARAVYRLRDERGLFSDVIGVGILRLCLLEMGRRLVDRGRLSDAELTFETTIDELVSLFGDAPKIDAGELVARRELRLALTEAGPPRFLGDPPPPPPPVDQLPPELGRVMASVGFCIEGILGQLDGAVGDQATVGGVPASAGTYEGRARVVRTLDELDDIDVGDVLVAPATSESITALLHLVGAIVTDHGSFVSHAAIVSREMGIPCVVGTVDASRRITDGSRIRVDGDRGEVTILG